MKFTINQKLFSAALSRVQGITGSRLTMPILANVLLSTSAPLPLLHISVSDLEVGYTTVIDCNDIETPGSITVPAKKLYEVVKGAPTGEIGFSLDPTNNRVTIEAGTFVTTLAGLPADEFPEVNRVDGEDLELDAAALLRLIGHVDYAQCAVPEKYNICGVFLQIKDDDEGCSRLYAAATDGHRLAADSVPLPGDPRVIPTDLAKGIIIPRKGIAELKKIAPEGVLILQILGNNLSISTENETFTLRLVDGQFPDIQRIIPTKILGSVHFNRQPLIDALDRVSLLSEGKYHAVTLSFDEGHIQLDSQNPELGEAHDRVTAALEGEASDRRINAAFLTQALSVLESGVAEIHLANDLSPVLVTPYCEKEPYAIVMPLRA